MRIHNKPLAILLIVLLVIPLASLACGQTAIASILPKPQNQTRESTFGVGSGIVWPGRVFAPFVDITAWVSDKNYSSGGALDLAKVYLDTGVLFYNLGFIAFDKNNKFTTGVFGKMVNWNFGGYAALTEGSSHSQYQGIKNTISSIRAYGGDVAISIGGGIENSNFFQTTQDVEILTNTYLDIIYGFGLTRLDLDIEGAGQSKAINIANAKAIRQAQQATGVEVSLTLPAAPSGLSLAGQGVLDAYLEQGVDIKIVNIMTMCYGSDTLKKGESYGEGAIRAGESLKVQLQQHYLTKTGLRLTDAQSYSRIGTTISIGYQSTRYPIFTTQWTQLMYEWAKTRDIGMLSFWSLGRDSKTQANKGVGVQYEFTNIYKGFTQNGLLDSNQDNGLGEKLPDSSPTIAPDKGSTAELQPEYPINTKGVLFFGATVIFLIIIARLFFLVKTFIR